MSKKSSRVTSAINSAEGRKALAEAMIKPLIDRKVLGFRDICPVCSNYVDSLGEHCKQMNDSEHDVLEVMGS